MACPTCDHTMQSVIEFTFQCPRCGTLRIKYPDEVELDFVPELVARVKSLCAELTTDVPTAISRTDIAIECVRMGIFESVGEQDRQRIVQRIMS